MLLQAVILIFLFFISFLNISLLLVPLFAIFAVIFLGVSGFVGNLKIVLFFICLTSLTFLLFVSINEIFQFYTGFRIKKRLKKYIKYEETVYNKMLYILLQELKSHVKLENDWVKFYLVNKEEISVNAFSCNKFGVICFSFGFVNELTRLVLVDKLKTLEAIEFLIGHEVSHMQNQDFTIGEFYLGNLACSNFLKKFYNIIFFILTVPFSVLPLFGKPFHIITTFVIKKIIEGFSLFEILFKSFFEFTKSYLMRPLEFRADKESVEIFGKNSITSFFEMLKGYSHKFSNNSIPESIRIKKTLNFRPKNKFAFPEEIKELLITCHALLLVLNVCLIIFCYFKIKNLDFIEFKNLLEVNINQILQLFVFIKEKLSSYLTLLKQIIF